MKHFTLILALIMFAGLGNTINAQQDGYEKIKSIQVNFFNEKMDLSTDQAHKFWPIYNKYEQERREIWREIKKAKESGSPSELKKIEALEKKRFDLTTKYKSQFLSVISTKQLSQMYQAEEEWRQMVLDKRNKD